jgi:hypothetical protein
LPQPDSHRATERQETPNTLPSSARENPMRLRSSTILAPRLSGGFIVAYWLVTVTISVEVSATLMVPAASWACMAKLAVPSAPAAIEVGLY